MQAASRRSDSFRREVAVKGGKTGRFCHILPSRAIFSRRLARGPGWASRPRHAGRASGWHAPATPAARRPHRARPQSIVRLHLVALAHNFRRKSRRPPICLSPVQCTHRIGRANWKLASTLKQSHARLFCTSCQSVEGWSVKTRRIG